MLMASLCIVFVLFVNDTATTEIYTYGHTLSLHDALPILRAVGELIGVMRRDQDRRPTPARRPKLPQDRNAVDVRHKIIDHEAIARRSEEHTSELQSLMRISYAVFCLKKTKKHNS